MATCDHFQELCDLAMKVGGKERVRRQRYNFFVRLYFHIISSLGEKSGIRAIDPDLF